VKENPISLPSFLGLELQKQQLRAQVPSHCFCFKEEKKRSTQKAATAIFILSKHGPHNSGVKITPKIQDNRRHDST